MDNDAAEEPSVACLHCMVITTWQMMDVSRITLFSISIRSNL